MIQTSLVNLHFVDRDNGAVHRGRVVARIEPGWFLYETDACETLRLASVEQMRAWEFHLAEEADAMTCLGCALLGTLGGFMLTGGLILILDGLRARRAGR